MTKSIDAKIIKVTVEKNPKRPGSQAYKKFRILMKMDGKPVEDYKAKEGRTPTLDKERGWPATELRWALKLNLVKLIPSS